MFARGPFHRPFESSLSKNAQAKSPHTTANTSSGTHPGTSASTRFHVPPDLAATAPPHLSDLAFAAGAHASSHSPARVVPARRLWPRFVAPSGRTPRVQVKVLLSPEARKMLRALARRRKLLMGEYLEALIREEHRKG